MVIHKSLRLALLEVQLTYAMRTLHNSLESSMSVLDQRREPILCVWYNPTESI